MTIPPDTDTNAQSISLWLEAATPRVAENGALVQTIAERGRPDQLNSLLAAELQNTRFSQDLLEECAEILGIEYSNELIRSVTPTVPKMRKGFFGEMVAACCLQEFDGCWIALQKPGFAITANQSLPGTDVLAAYLNNGEIETLVFAEAKLRTSRDSRVVLQAASQAITDSQNEFAPIIGFVLRRLHESGDHMFRPFLNYLEGRRRRPPDELPYVYLVLEQGAWSDNDVSVLDDLNPMPPGFRVSVVEVENLAQLVAQSYALIGAEVDETDDE